jgi:hypothetical protein
MRRTLGPHSSGTLQRWDDEHHDQALRAARLLIPATTSQWRAVPQIQGLAVTGCRSVVSPKAIPWHKHGLPPGEPRRPAERASGRDPLSLRRICRRHETVGMSTESPEVRTVFAYVHRGEPYRSRLINGNATRGGAPGRDHRGQRAQTRPETTGAAAPPAPVAELPQDGARVIRAAGADLPFSGMSAADNQTRPIPKAAPGCRARWPATRSTRVRPASWSGWPAPSRAARRAPPQPPTAGTHPTTTGAPTADAANIVWHVSAP